MRVNAGSSGRREADFFGVECAWPAAAGSPWSKRRPAGAGATRRLAAWAAAAILAFGLWHVGQAAWIHAKARLAQFLVEQAWTRTLSGEAQARPWPWADTWPVARLRAPTQGVDLFVLAGANGRTIAFGPGHVFGTPLPGDTGNSAIGGHRDTHFAFLQWLRHGDEIEVENGRGERVRYRVVHTEVVDKGEVRVLAQPAHGRELTLVTCYPFDAVRPGGPLRYVVSATAVEGRPPPSREAPSGRTAT